MHLPLTNYCVAFKPLIDNQLCIDDIEHHSFEEIAIVPAVSLSGLAQIDRNAALVAQELQLFKESVDLRQNGYTLYSAQ
jgi:hypothetical protein